MGLKSESMQQPLFQGSCWVVCGSLGVSSTWAQQLGLFTAHPSPTQEFVLHS